MGKTGRGPDHVEVKAATLANGLLHVDLVREIPEQLKPRQIRLPGPSSRIGYCLIG
jgi:molecular chaperone IbpA